MARRIGMWALGIYYFRSVWSSRGRVVWILGKQNLRLSYLVLGFCRRHRVSVHANQSICREALKYLMDPYGMMCLMFRLRSVGAVMPKAIQELSTYTWSSRLRAGLPKASDALPWEDLCDCAPCGDSGCEPSPSPCSTQCFRHEELE